MVKIGDIFKIPLQNDRVAYGQYVFKDRKQGPLIQVYDFITSDTNSRIDRTMLVKYLFPPVITGLFAAIRSGLWQVVDNYPVKNFVYPKFISAYYDERTGKVIKWFIWDGKNYIPLGSRINDEQKQLEFLVVWSPYDIIYRIETGKYPYPYGSNLRQQWADKFPH
jgi:hypothetical protein